jgi:large subunit ribosomal protein L30
MDVWLGRRKSIMGELKITLVKSLIGTKPKQRLNVKALGLGKLNSSVVQKDNAATRGMIRKVSHLVKVEEV